MCDYVKENGTVEGYGDEEDIYDEHGHLIDHDVDQFGHRVKRQSTGKYV